MIPITSGRIEKLIKDAEVAGVSEAELQELRDLLSEMKQGTFNSTTSTKPIYEQVKEAKTIKSDRGRERG